MRRKIIIENGWIKEKTQPSEFFLSLFNRNKKVAKIKDNFLAQELVDCYNEKHNL